MKAGSANFQLWDGNTLYKMEVEIVMLKEDRSSDLNPKQVENSDVVVPMKGTD